MSTTELAQPRPNLPQTCCCGCSLQTGVIIIAVLQAAYSAIAFYAATAFGGGLTDFVGVPLWADLAISLLLSCFGMAAGCLCVGVKNSHTAMQVFFFGTICTMLYNVVNLLVLVVDPHGSAERLCDSVRDILNDDSFDDTIFNTCVEGVENSVSSVLVRQIPSFLLGLYYLFISYAYERQLFDTKKMHDRINSGEGQMQTQPNNNNVVYIPQQKIQTHAQQQTALVANTALPQPTMAAQPSAPPQQIYVQQPLLRQHQEMSHATDFTGGQQQQTNANTNLEAINMDTNIRREPTDL